MPEDRLAALEERLGHRFANRALLEMAVTHASYLSPEDARLKSYQRLEFLGDRVLGLTIANLLFTRFPEAPEGHLSRALADLVRKETCAAIAEELGLAAALRVGKGERKNGLARKLAVLGDACEAVLAAVYLDAGYDAAAGVIERHWLRRIAGIDAGRVVDPKTALQEWAHTKALPEPVYKELGRSGPDHAPRFRVAALVQGLAPSEGEGKSKREAERAAAEAMLAREAANWMKQ